MQQKEIETPEQIAQWVINNRYPKSELDKLSDHELYYGLVDKIKAGAEWVNEQKVWVRLEDRLPEPGQKIDLWLVIDGNGNGHRYSWHWEKQDTAQIRIIGCKATHWMPYPSPPTI